MTQTTPDQIVPSCWPAENDLDRLIEEAADDDRGFGPFLIVGLFAALYMLLFW